MQSTRNKGFDIIFPENIDAELLPELNDRSVPDLVMMINESVKAKELKLADQYAKKLAIDHGVPGIICLYNVQILHLQQLHDSGEEIGKLCFNLLTYLYLGERLMLMTRPSEMKEIAALFPEQDVTKTGFWKSIIDRVVELGNVSNEMKSEAKGVGLKMLQTGHAGARGQQVKNK